MNKLSMLLLAAAAVLNANCSPLGDTIKGNGVMKTENRSIADFTAVEVSGAFEVKWSSGEPALSVSTDENILPLVTTSVSGNTLHIACKEGSMTTTRGLTINLSSSALKEVRLNGAVSLAASALSGPDLKLEANGASSLNVDGAVKSLAATLSGASRLAAKSLQSESATIEANGASFADVTTTETLKASVSGASALTYSGNPKSVKQNVSGASRVQSRP